MKDLVAVVLAGGTGTRFWPFTSDKILFPFLGKPFLDWSVLRALPSSVSRVVIVANQVNRDVMESLPLAIPHTLVVQNQAKGMADALLTAKEELAGKRLLIMIADHLIDAELLQNVVRKAEHTEAFGVIPGMKVNTLFPGGYLELDGDVVRGIVEKPEKGKEPSQYVNISGHYIADADVLLSELSKSSGEGDDVYEQAVTRLMHHTTFLMVPYEGVSATLKYPWHVLDVARDLLRLHAKRHVGKNVELKSNVCIEGDVYLDDDVRVFENSKIVGPCYIGKGTIIGNNNIIRESTIGAHCVTGFNTDITRSYVGDNCWFHSNYVGDSVLESDISMGSGVVLANLRLDESEILSIVKGEKVPTDRNKLGAMIGKNVRIGVNASIMPGIKIGHDSFISSGAIVNRDVPEQSFVEVKPQMEIKRNAVSIAGVTRDSFRDKL